MTPKNTNHIHTKFVELLIPQQIERDQICPSWESVQELRLHPFVPIRNQIQNLMSQVSLSQISNISSKNQNAKMLNLPESGAYVCIGSVQHLNELNAPKKDLVPFKRTISGVSAPCLNTQGESLTYKSAKRPNQFTSAIKLTVYFSKAASLDVILPKTFLHPSEPFSGAVHNKGLSYLCGLQFLQFFG